MGLSAPPPSWGTLQNKPTTVSGFGISDMASQTVANATNATNATNVTNVTATQVLNATATAAAGAVGTYATLSRNTGTAALSAGATYAGSSLRYAGVRNYAAPDGAGSVVAGTWRAVGNVTSSPEGELRMTTFLRIS